MHFGFLLGFWFVFWLFCVVWGFFLDLFSWGSFNLLPSIVGTVKQINV